MDIKKPWKSYTEGKYSSGGIWSKNTDLLVRLIAYFFLNDTLQHFTLNLVKLVIKYYTSSKHKQLYNKFTYTGNKNILMPKFSILCYRHILEVN